MYKSFLLRGPADYYLRIGRNNSLNTLCSGLFIDRMTGPMAGFEDMAPIWLGTCAMTPRSPPTNCPP